MKSSIGQRGKTAEKKVRELLERLSRMYAFFDYERIYDARSAGGRFPSRPGDFAFYRPECHGLIEAKEVDHEYRLSRAKFPQLAALHKRKLAGGLIVPLVLHTPKMLWRMVPFDWLLQAKDVPSWDLQEFPTYSDLADIPGLNMAFVGMKGLRK